MQSRLPCFSSNPFNFGVMQFLKCQHLKNFISQPKTKIHHEVPNAGFPFQPALNEKDKAQNH